MGWFGILNTWVVWQPFSAMTIDFMDILDILERWETLAEGAIWLRLTDCIGLPCDNYTYEDRTNHT